MMVDDGLTPHFLTSKELKRIAIIRRYSNVARDLPQWAQDALGIKMGNIEVTARDSFELFLIRSGGSLPKYDYVNFQKRFVEIFETRGFVVLVKIVKSRSQNREFFVSNDYFWQEFAELFTFKPLKIGSMDVFFNTIFKFSWIFWNQFLARVLRASRENLKVGITGSSKRFRWMLFSKGTNAKKESVRWK